MRRHASPPLRPLASEDVTSTHTSETGSGEISQDVLFGWPHRTWFVRRRKEKGRLCWWLSLVFGFVLRRSGGRPEVVATGAASPVVGLFLQKRLGENGENGQSVVLIPSGRMASKSSA